jgi:cytochrome P450
MQEVFITQFTRFHSRRIILAHRVLGEEHSNVFSAHIAQSWKKQRKILNPTFSGAKMRRLLPTVETCINIFIERLSLTIDGTIINIYEIYKRLTMDVICKFCILLEFRFIRYGSFNRSMCI